MPSSDQVENPGVRNIGRAALAALMLLAGPTQEGLQRGRSAAAIATPLSRGVDAPLAGEELRVRGSAWPALALRCVSPAAALGWAALPQRLTDGAPLTPPPARSAACESCVLLVLALRVRPEARPLPPSSRRAAECPPRGRPSGACIGPLLGVPRPEQASRPVGQRAHCASWAISFPLQRAAFVTPVRHPAPAKSAVRAPSL
mmetsp:Transcript_533/g.1653  ORF Transcript_533/g.1653 Transcript_533/m.1653 type:complete len:202 (+) Transcript_533:209-814(+)